MLLCVGFLVLSFFSCQIRTFHVSIEPKRGFLAVEKGQPMTFYCSVKDFTEEGQGHLEELVIKWLKNGEEIVSGPELEVEENEEQNMVNIIIQTSSESHQGNYTCRVSSAGQVVEKVVEVEVYEMPSFEGTEGIQHPLMYTDAWIECKVKAKPSPRIKWKYNGRIVRGGDRYSIDQTRGLLVKNITQGDNGLYVCNAEPAGVGRHTDFPINVEVYEIPKIFGVLDLVTAHEGKSAHIRCEATGIPRATFKFYKDYGITPLDTSPGLSVDEEGKLRWKNVTSEDAGLYKCEAFNDAGKTFRLSRLEVLAPPRIVIFTNQSIDTNHPLLIECSSSGFPIPNMTLFKVKEKGDLELLTQVSSDSKARLGRCGFSRNVTLATDYGEYLCVSQNNIGEDNKTVTIEVVYKPFFYPPPKQVKYILTHHPNNITCTVMANPGAQVTWTKGVDPEENINDNDVYQVFHENEGFLYTSTLQITSDEDESGIYTCKASNYHGIRKQAINIKLAVVPEAPELLPAHENFSTAVQLDIKVGWNGGNSISKFIIKYNVQGKNDSKTTVVDKVPPKDNDESFTVKVGNLTPSTIYDFHVSAVNLVGTGPSSKISIKTEDISVPEAVVVEREPLACYKPHNITIKWKKPDSSGVPVEKYRVKYRQIHLSSVSDWISKETTNLHYDLEGLVSSSKYELHVSAKNIIGWSPETQPFEFHICKDAISVQSSASTKPKEDTSLEEESQPNNTGWLLGIVFAVLLIVCIVVDLACYAANNCGVTKLICSKLGKGKDKDKLEKVENEEREFLNMDEKQVNNQQHPTKV